MSTKFDREGAGYTLKDVAPRHRAMFWETRSGTPDETLYAKLDEWLRNFKTNYDTIGFPLCVSKLPRLKDKPAIVIDNPMTGSLNKHLKSLKLAKEKGCTLFACDRALPKLAQHEVTPAYVGNVDSSYLCLGFFDRPEVKPIMKETTAIFATTVFPLTIRAWQGQRAFFTPYLGSNELTTTLAAKSNTVIMGTGGNIATTLWILAVCLEAKVIGIVGIDNSYNDLEETEYPGVYHHRVKTPHGLVYQDAVYKYYADLHKEYIKIEKEQNGVTTVNLNKGGAMYSPDIVDMSWEQFFKKYG